MPDPVLETLYELSCRDGKLQVVHHVNDAECRPGLLPLPVKLAVEDKWVWLSEESAVEIAQALLDVVRIREPKEPKKPANPAEPLRRKLQV